MGFPRRILNFVAQIGLELIVGEKRSVQIIELASDAWQGINAWFRAGSPPEKEESPADLAAVAKEVNAPPEKIADLKFFLEQVQKAAANETDPARLLFDDVLPRREAIYILWLEKDVIGGDAGRYVHFNWSPGNDRIPIGFRIRDYINRTMFHPEGLPGKEKGWESKALDLSAIEIWRKAKDRWPGIVRFNLSKGVVAKNDDWWTRELTKMTGCRRSGLGSG